jgi:hypothetical protein
MTTPNTHAAHRATTHSIHAACADLTLASQVLAAAMPSIAERFGVAAGARFLAAALDIDAAVDSSVVWKWAVSDDTAPPRYLRSCSLSLCFSRLESCVCERLFPVGCCLCEFFVFLQAFSKKTSYFFALFLTLAICLSSSA